MATRTFMLENSQNTGCTFPRNMDVLSTCLSYSRSSAYCTSNHHVIANPSELDVSLVDELSPPSSLKYSNICFDQDISALKTCAKRPVTKKQITVSSEVAPVSSLEHSADCNLLKNTVAPVSSARLRPIRQKTKNVMLTIMDDRSVIMEFLKNLNGQDMVLEVMKISVDGLKVQVFHPFGNQGYQLSDCPPNLDTSTQVKEYHYTELPAKYMKRYQYAARFLRLVQSKTTKITMYTEQAKCMLMENAPGANFEAVFYKGARVTLSRGGVRLTKSDGTNTHMPPSDRTQNLMAEDRHLLNYTHECHEKCLQLESVLESLQSKKSSTSYEGFSPFPVIVGRKPGFFRTKDKDNSSWFGSDVSSNQSQHPALSTCSEMSRGTPSPQPESPRSMASSQGSQTSHNNSKISSGSMPPSIVCRVHVPQVGWGIQLSNGVVLVQFNDGSELAIQSSPMVITYKDINNAYSRYDESDSLPAHVCQKLATLPNVMTQLQDACTSRPNSPAQQ